MDVDVVELKKVATLLPILMQSQPDCDVALNNKAFSVASVLKVWRKM